MAYVLIIFSYVYWGYAPAMHEFSDKAACERALEAAQKARDHVAGSSAKVGGACVPKSSEGSNG